jgi:hypothetical protein
MLTKKIPMVEKEQIREAIIDNLQVDNEGLKDVKVLDISRLQGLGVTDIPAFLQGVLDAENDNDFNESTEDYVKGYRYATTGTF